MRASRTPTVWGIALLLAAPTAFGTEMKSDVRPRKTIHQVDVRSSRHRSTAGRKLPYRLLIPAGYETSTDAHPLLVFLHGAGERGGNNRAQLTHGKRLLCKAAIDYDCFVLAPQCPCGGWWAGRHWADPEHGLTEEPSETMHMLVELIDELEKEYRIDADRLYIMGLSMGGFGVWDAVERYPKRFAAAVPICGGGDETRAAQIAHVPVWVFHGRQDPVVSAQLSRTMVRALRAAGGDPRFTEYADVGHNSWDKAFNEPELLDWLTAQQRQTAR